jgi:hypothetical protein
MQMFFAMTAFPCVTWQEVEPAPFFGSPRLRQILTLFENPGASPLGGGWILPKDMTLPMRSRKQGLNRFTAINMFGNGRIVSLAKLRAGQRTAADQSP